MVLNDYLKSIEEYLSDLTVIQRNHIISRISNDLRDKESFELSALDIANKYREQNGHAPYIVKKQTSVLAVLFKFFLICFLLFAVLIGVLAWKFTPLIAFDEERSKITILGGYIEIDGEAGKFKVGNDFHFANSNFKNVFQADIPIDSQKDIELNFKTGLYTFENTQAEQLSLDCKLDSPPKNESIEMKKDKIEVDFTDYQGTCNIKIPRDLNVDINVQAANITLLNPEYNVDVDLKYGSVFLGLDDQDKYQFDLNVKSGITENFQSSSNGPTIKIEIKEGSILKYSK